ncbi:MULTISPECIES: hypothetical protein [unclassified Ectothiorhodospira]|uniref:hypothetical protein n=1 Tax=unclassified Ectothiorhodospira TaxID=2684909 RepID=UPI001EE96C58|nr:MULTISPECIES: hypothetical protein [unclassified Ectothiorhodospira]MCG5516252.1 hypothetical protein [Ectothiorhodospira sp. 9100]MCG5518075.1 hypothetical protein [Ectothiorhodospira sp. 9905]
MKVMLSKHRLGGFPSLPSRHATLFGWAPELLVLVQMNQLPEHHRPKSYDPDFWAVWLSQDSDIEKAEREVDLKANAGNWHQVNISTEERKPEGGDE